MATVAAPTTFEEAADGLVAATAAGHAVRIRGAGAKAGWGSPVAEPDVELRTSALDRIVEHNAGDLTAVLEAGVPVSRAQEAFAEEPQMLALDPALGRGSDRYATIGGVIATGDSGPLRHRYGAPRDLIVGMTVALSDGTIARSGGKVIKNVAGYDLAKLFCGSFGTLGLILEVNVRLHPLPASTATALGVSGDPATLAAAGRNLAAAPLELEALDVAWRAGRGGLLARCGGAAALARSEHVAGLLRQEGLDGVSTEPDDADLWARQRAGQRSLDRALVRVAARPSQLAAVLGAAEACSGTLVGRVALGISFVELDPDAVEQLTDKLPPGARTVLLDAPPELRSRLDAWGASPGADALELMKRVKARFDPAQTCNPGLFVGGI